MVVVPNVNRELLVHNRPNMMRVGAWTEMGSPDVMARCVMYGARALTHDWQKYQKQELG